MKRTGNAVLTHAGRTLAMLGLGATMSLAVVSAPAQAAASMGLVHSITVPGLVRHEIRVQVFMSQSQAQSQINNGARIQMDCWGSDEFFDDHLAGCPDPFRGGTVTYQGVQLTASSTGVRLTIVNLYNKGTTLNEDIADRDEIYVTARWIDAGGAITNARSSTESGWF